jgi:FixJ family two-component response regulator
MVADELRSKHPAGSRMTAVRPTIARLQWFKKGNSAYRAQNERSSVANSEVAILSRRKVVFVVDDDPSVLKGLERLLRVHGFDVELFDSAESFRDRAGVDEAICVFLDINLTGESGIELRRELTSAGAALPVIFMTADDSEATWQAAQDAGCVAFLSKPFTAKLLMDAITRASAGPGQTA